MYKDKSPRLSLVGAGPGDPELLTIKGARILASADVVLYDALINKELLDMAPYAEKIFVGKRSGAHSYSQEQINELITNNALAKGHVVRLKGGDPFIFGRGIEELRYASRFGIVCEVIPGISSTVAVPAYQGISITERQVAESFWVITATTTKDKLSNDVAIAAQSSATVVILMGMRKLQEIVTIYTQMGHKNKPIAIIQNGTTPHEKIGIDTIENIIDLVEVKQLKPPATIIIGEVVALRYKDEAHILNHYSKFGLSL